MPMLALVCGSDLASSTPTYVPKSTWHVRIGYTTLPLTYEDLRLLCGTVCEYDALHGDEYNAVEKGVVRQPLTYLDVK